MRGKRLKGRGVTSMLGAAGMVFLVFIAVVAGGCGGSEDASSSADESAEQEVAEQQSEPTTTGSDEESAVPVGEPVTVGDVAWTVTDVLQSDILVSRLGSEEGNFVIVDVTFQNNANQDITFATPFITLLDSQGNEFEPDISANFTHIDPDQNMFAAHVEPGVTKEGKVIFSVDPDSSGFKLKVGEARFGSDKSAYIDLGI